LPEARLYFHDGTRFDARMSVDPHAALAAAARGYIDAVDAVEDRVTRELLATLATLYAAAVALPSAEFEEWDGPEPDLALREAAESRLRSVLGPLDDVLTTGWSPHTDEYEAFQTSLAYGLAKVYDGALYILGGQPAWDSRFDFWQNWGEYGAAAQHALFGLFESSGPLEWLDL
jgi:hypothetical protein